jgi:UTP:GlnB (protein PII) uridylyltransferase
MIQKVSYRVEQGNVPYQVLTMNVYWRKLPYILDRLREHQYDIRKAHLKKDMTTLYVKNTDHPISKEMTKKELDEIIADGYHDCYTKQSKNQIILPINTEILLYNVPGSKNTTLEFSCQDRMGLLSDMLELLTIFPYEIYRGNISTVGPYAHNMFFLQQNKKPLKKEDIDYIMNVFDYEVKSRISPSYKEPSL